MPAVSRPNWTFVVADSLEKVFADEEPRAMDLSIPLTAFAGETVSFQIAFRPPAAQSFDDVGVVVVAVDGDAAHFTALSSVELVPCTLLAYDGHDDGYLRDTAGLYPDLLKPLGAKSEMVPYLGQWRAVWVSVTAPDGVEGEVPVTVNVHSARTSALLHTVTVPVQFSTIRLPELDIVNTHWVHCDGLADFYGDDVFSEEHWRTIERFIAKAAEMGVNSVLTPTWTPPLDTAVGSVRRPVQLIDVIDEGGAYRFDFAKLQRWMAICRRSGMRGLEIAHLFTQWGAEYTPAVYVMTDDGLEQRFGWHVRATDPEYRRLLEALLPGLLDVLAAEWGLDNVIFHISDEPHGPRMLESYQAARAVVVDLLAGVTVVDALSDYEFYTSGAVEHPVVATDALEPFLEHGVPNLWVYHCLAQHKDVANRSIGLPSYRNRVLGTQLFLLGVVGFLHWGFNFYNTQYSTRPLNPFQDTCAGGGFIAGDAFIVYPGDGGVPWESLRFRVFAEGMTDHRAMQLLRDLAGMETVRSIVDPEGTVTATRYSTDPDHYRRVRAALSAEIVQRSASPSASEDVHVQ